MKNKHTKRVRKLYQYGSFAKFIRATGNESSDRLKHWYAKYYQIPKSYTERFKCCCNHTPFSHTWTLADPFVSTEDFKVLGCNKKNCPCKEWTTDNLKWVKGVADGKVQQQQ